VIASSSSFILSGARPFQTLFFAAPPRFPPFFGRLCPETFPALFGPPSALFRVLFTVSVILPIKRGPFFLFPGTIQCLGVSRGLPPSSLLSLLCQRSLFRTALYYSRRHMVFPFSANFHGHPFSVLAGADFPPRPVITSSLSSVFNRRFPPPLSREWFYIRSPRTLRFSFFRLASPSRSDCYSYWEANSSWSASILPPLFRDHRPSPPNLVFFFRSVIRPTNE